MYYVVCLMETRKASKAVGVGYRSFWLLHSGPYPDLESCNQAAREVPGSFALLRHRCEYYCTDALATEKKNLDIYGLRGRGDVAQRIFPNLQEVV